MSTVVETPQTTASNPSAAPAAPASLVFPRLRAARPEIIRQSKKWTKRIVSLAIATYLIPKTLCVYVACGVIDVARNRPWHASTWIAYFGGNGVFTWLLSPLNLAFDLLTLPYRNRGIYRLEDLPAPYRAEVETLIDACHRRDLVGALEAKMGDKKRGMIFFQWYGKILDASVDIPEFRRRYRYIRTIGVSIFNTWQSTDKHFGPLRASLRVLYNVNQIDDPNVYVQVGDHINRWRDNKLFIFDDTLQHASYNHSHAARYCLFVDILRPSLMPNVFSAIITTVRLVMAPFRAVFYKHWTFLK